MEDVESLALKVMERIQSGPYYSELSNEELYSLIKKHIKIKKDSIIDKELIKLEKLNKTIEELDDDVYEAIYSKIKRKLNFEVRKLMAIDKGSLPKSKYKR